MKNKVLLFILATIIITPYFSFAQPVVYSWAKNFGGRANYEGSLGIAKDASGNLYVIGEFSGSRTFGPFTLTAAGFSEVFVARYSPTGVCDWAIKGGSNFASAYAGKIAVQGNEVFITGNFSNIIAMGAFAIASSGNKDIFLASLDATTGNCNWLEKAGGSYDDLGLDITPANGGGFFICGSFTDVATFGSFTVTSSSIIDRDIFLARYNAAGVCTWVKRIGDTGTDFANAIVQTPTGELYVTGAYEGSVQFGPGITLNSVGFADLFLAKFSLNGNLLSAFSAGGDNTDIGYALDLDPSGNIYMTGFIADTANFGSIVVNNGGNVQVFTAKFSAAGAPQWVRTGGAILDDIGYDITVDAGGSSYVTGYINGNANFSGTMVTGVQVVDAFIVKYDTFGTLRWITKIGTNGYDQGKAILLDAAGFCHAVGDFSNTANFGTTTLVANPGDYEVYLTRVGGGSVGLDENGESFFSVYPNPASDFVSLDLSKITDDAFTLEVISADGKVALTKLINQNEVQSNYRLELNQFSKGNYILTLSTSKGDYSRKVVIQ